MERFFLVANAAMEVSSDRPITVSRQWRLFETTSVRPALRYRVCHVPELPQLTGRLLFDNGRVRVFDENGRQSRIYTDTVTGKETVAVREWENACWEIAVQEELLPWGTDVSDLFVQYGLPRRLPQQGKLLLHCAYILYNGRAILFTAPSGTGKTTQAKLWQRSMGSRIVNGDRAAIGLEGGIVTAYGLPISGTSPDCENVTAPVAAIVSLSQAKENRVTRLRAASAVKPLLSGTYLPPEFAQDLPLLVDLAASLAARVPVYHLQCLPDESAVQALAARIDERTQ